MQQNISFHIDIVSEYHQGTSKKRFSFISLGTSDISWVQKPWVLRSSTSWRSFFAWWWGPIDRITMFVSEKSKGQQVEFYSSYLKYVWITSSLIGCLDYSCSRYTKLSLQILRYYYSRDEQKSRVLIQNFLDSSSDEELSKTFDSSPIRLAEPTDVSF